MKVAVSAAAALMLGTSMAGALGLDRSNQDITAIFEPGNYIELSYGHVTPRLTGVDVLGNQIDNVGGSFNLVSGSIKMDLTPMISFALIVDQPFGVDILYPGSPATTMLGGTAASLDSRAMTAVARYRINDRISFHGGVRRETLNADITLAGLAYGGLNGYNVSLGDSSATGYVVGAAYEIPDIALRVALTYNSSMEHEFPSVERIGAAVVNPGSTTTVRTPEAWNLDFQTGVAADTLVFGSIRYAQYSQTLVSPDFFAGATGGSSLTDIDDGYAYNLGVGRRFSEALSAQVSVGYEAKGDDLVSPLSPTNGQVSLGVGGQYTMGDVVLSAGVRYTWLGDARPETGTPDTERARFTDNSAVAVGLSVGYRF